MELKEIRKYEPKSNIDIKKVPDAFEGVLVAESLDTDNNGKVCLYWDISIDGERFRQKYTPAHIKTLADRLEMLKVTNTNTLLNKKMGFEKLETVGFPRWYPVVILE